MYRTTVLAALSGYAHRDTPAYAIAPLVIVLSFLTAACEDARPGATPHEGDAAAPSNQPDAGGATPTPTSTAFEHRTKYAKLTEAVVPAGCATVETSKLYRYVEGVDRCMIELSKAEIDANLKDPFTTSVLSTGQRPASVEAIVAAMADAKLSQASYLVGEGTQVPIEVAPRDADRNLRYVVSWTDANNAPGVFLSAAPGGHSSFLQVIAWDAQNEVFNFYEHRAQLGGGAVKAWSWAGETKQAASAPSRGVGCFDCHHNGVTIMKELTAPWNNWQSQLAAVSPGVVPANVAGESLFTKRTGAENLESLIRGGYQTYYRAWLRANYQRQPDGTTKLTEVDEMLRRLVSNTTVNFAASQVQSRGRATSPPNAKLTGIPSNLFVWDDVLRTGLGLTYTFPPLEFDRADYDAFLKKYAFRLEQTGPAGYRDPGSTWFSFFTPVPAMEDQYLILQLQNANVFDKKFAAAILLVDFANPVFSDKRASLERYAAKIETGTIDAAGKSSVVTDFAALVKAAADKQPPCTGEPASCTAEQQFLSTWNLDGDWLAKSSKRVQEHLDTHVAGASLEAVMSLAQARRDAFTKAPLISNLDEFSLLLPVNTLSQK